MNSPSHKENILSSKYKEIGIGVIEGNLAGVDTTIIVQFLVRSMQTQSQLHRLPKLKQLLRLQYQF